MSVRLYRIKDWSRHYETHESRKLKRLDWVAMPNKHDGLGFRLVAAEKDAPVLLAAWTLIVQIASRGDKDARGALSRDGRPLTSREMALMTGFPAKIFDRAFTFFTQDRIGWLVAEQWQTDLPLLADEPAESAGAPASAAGRTPIQDRTEQDRTEHNTEGGASPRRAAGAAPLTDEQWLDSLKADPAYRGIDVAREFAKMNAWCRENKREPNRRRFINWLNKCDRPLNTGSGMRPAPPPVAEPHGWKAFLNHEFPESVYSANGSSEAHQWSDLTPDLQRWLVGEMRKKGEL